jgi:hypothetical protein
LLPELHQISSFASVDEHVELLRHGKPSMFSSYAISLESLPNESWKLVSLISVREWYTAVPCRSATAGGPWSSGTRSYPSRDPYARWPGAAWNGTVQRAQGVS